MSTNQTSIKLMALEAQEFIHYGDRYLVRNLREAVVNSRSQEVVYIHNYDMPINIPCHIHKAPIGLT